MQQRGYQGGPQKDYSEGYGQGQQGKRSWRQNPQSQYYGQSKDSYYGNDQYYQDQSGSGYGEYQDPYQDPYYYPPEDKGNWAQQEYPEDYAGYQQQDHRQYYQGEYHQGKKGQSQKPLAQQKPFKKQYSQQQQPKPQRKYPQEQGRFGKGDYSGPHSQDMQEHMSEKDQSSGQQSRYPHPSHPSLKESIDDKLKSGRKGSSLPEAQKVNPGGQGATKPAYGQYYTQKRFQEQEQQKKLQDSQNPNEPGQSSNSSPQLIASADFIASKTHMGTLSSLKKSTTDQTQTKDNVTNTAGQNEIEDERFSNTMAKFNTLDRGTYFVREDNKKAHFMLTGRADILGWKDTYVINGYLLHGVILKIMTLTSRIFLFIENLHSIYNQFIRVGEDGETVYWTDEMPDLVHIVTVTNIEKVEVLDNDEDGFEGFVCYTICEDSKIEFNHTPEEVEDWNYVQELILLYEPTSIRKIYLDVVYNSIYKPESKGFGGKRIAAIVNPHVPGETIQFSKKIVTALDKECVVGTIWIQNGRYTLIAETVEDMERLIKLVDLALDIAEELNAYVMITNLRRTFDYIGKTVLYISSDPTLKLIRSSNAINFANKIKKSENLT